MLVHILRSTSCCMVSELNAPTTGRLAHADMLRRAQLTLRPVAPTTADAHPGRPRTLIRTRLERLKGRASRARPARFVLADASTLRLLARRATTRAARSGRFAVCHPDPHQRTALRARARADDLHDAAAPNGGINDCPGCGGGQRTGGWWRSDGGRGRLADRSVRLDAGPQPDEVEIAAEAQAALAHVLTERRVRRRRPVVDAQRCAHWVADGSPVEEESQRTAVERASHVMPRPVPDVGRTGRGRDHVVRVRQRRRTQHPPPPPCRGRRSPRRSLSRRARPGSARRRATHQRARPPPRSWPGPPTRSCRATARPSCRRTAAHRPKRRRSESGPTRRRNRRPPVARPIAADRHPRPPGPRPRQTATGPTSPAPRRHPQELSTPVPPR